MRELVATLAGVIFGWIFNEITMLFRERTKLTFKIVSTPETELIDKEYRTKTSLSEHGIEITFHTYWILRIGLWHFQKKYCVFVRTLRACFALD